MKKNIFALVIACGAFLTTNRALATEVNRGPNYILHVGVETEGLATIGAVRDRPMYNNRARLACHDALLLELAYALSETQEKLGLTDSPQWKTKVNKYKAGVEKEIRQTKERFGIRLTQAKASSPRRGRRRRRA